MKKNLYFYFFILSFGLLNAQPPNVYVGANGSSWHDPANWSLGNIPLEGGGNIQIPEGKEVHILDGNTFNFRHGNITGSGTLKIYGAFNVIHQPPSIGSYIYGVHIINYGELNSYWVNGGESSTTTSFFNIRSGATLVNEISGVMNIGTNLISDETVDFITLINKGTINFTSEVLRYFQLGMINEGTIKATGGEVQVGSTYQYHRNINPTFIIEEGAEIIYQAKSYWEGDINGTNNGEFNFDSATKYIEAGKTATNKVNGNGIQMKFGSIEGPGTFVNDTKFTLSEGAASKQIRNITFENNGDFVIDQIGAHTNTRLLNSTFNNNSEGEFLIYGNFSMDNTTSTLNNYGAMRNYYDGGAYTGFNINNYGLIENHKTGLFYLANAGELINHETGVIKGYSFLFSGQLDKFLNKGRVAPGIDGVGTMEARITYDGFEQNATGILEFNLNSLTDYDVMQGYFGNVSNIGGKIDVILGFAPAIGDEFTVITADRTLNLNLTEPVKAVYNGYSYIFETILTNNDKNLILKLTDIVLGVEEQNFSTASVFPNPTKGNVQIQLRKSEQNVQVEIYNVSGQLLRKQKVQNTSGFEINMPDAKGVYLLKLITKEGITTKKIIKQ